MNDGVGTLCLQTVCELCWLCDCRRKSLARCLTRLLALSCLLLDRGRELYWALKLLVRWVTLLIATMEWRLTNFVTPLTCLDCVAASSGSTLTYLSISESGLHFLVL